MSSACPPPEKVKNHLIKWSEQVELLYENSQYSDVIFYVNELVDSLPFPIEKIEGAETHDPYWGEEGNRSDEEMIAIINTLTKLNECMFKSCFHLQGCHPKEKLTAAVSYAIQVKMLENLFGYQRSFSGDPIIGLGKGQVYEACAFHIENAIKTNEFSYDLKAKERAEQCTAYFRIENPRKGAINLFVDKGRFYKSSFLHAYLSEEGKKKLQMYHESLIKKALERGIECEIDEEYKKVMEEIGEKVEKEVDKKLLGCLCIADMGNFDLCPDFLTSLHKQMFITSYFFGQNNFARRSKGSSDEDAFSIISDQVDAVKKIVEEESFPESSIHLTVKGGGKSSVTNTVRNMQNRYLASYTNPSIHHLTFRYLRKSELDLNPNKSLVEFATFKDLSPEMAQELVTLINTPKSMILWQMFGFFNSNIDLFQNRDYQQFFELIFSTNLEQELRTNPETALQIQRFIQSALEDFKASSQIEAHLFLIRQGMFLEDMVHSLSKEGVGVKVFEKVEFADWNGVIRQRIKKAKTNVEKNTLQAQLAFSMVHENKDFDSQKLFDIVTGMALIQTGQVPKSMLGIEFSRPIEEWFQRHSEKIQDMTKGGEGSGANLVCNAALLAVEGRETEPGKWKELEFPIFESEDGLHRRVNIFTGEVVTQNSPKTRLPGKIVDNSNFNRLFGNEVRMGGLKGFDRYHFTYKNEDFRVEMQKSGECMIEQNIKGQWFRYLQTDLVKDAFPILMVSGHSHWISTDPSESKKIYIQNKEGKNCYIVPGRKAKKCIHTVF